MNNKYFNSEPTYRQAYNDRTAWVMSESAYIKLNPLFCSSMFFVLER